MTGAFVALPDIYAPIPVVPLICRALVASVVDTVHPVGSIAGAIQARAERAVGAAPLATPRTRNAMPFVHPLSARSGVRTVSEPDGVRRVSEMVAVLAPVRRRRTAYSLPAGVRRSVT